MDTQVPVKPDDTDVRQQEEEPVYNPLYVPGKGDRPFVSKEVPGQLRMRAGPDGC